MLQRSFQGEVKLYSEKVTEHMAVVTVGSITSTTVDLERRQHMVEGEYWWLGERGEGRKGGEEGEGEEGRVGKGVSWNTEWDGFSKYMFSDFTFSI